MSEAELFSAYRNTTGWESQCACGGSIVSQLGTASAVEEAVAVHQESTVHQQWRGWQEAVQALQRPAKHPCPCHDHGA